MFEEIYGFVAPYASVVLLSTVISSISLLGLRLFDIRSYRARTITMLFPLIGSFALALTISPSCFIHYFSIQTLDPVHLICVNSSYAYLQSICTSWVLLISASFGIAGMQGVTSFFFGKQIVSKIFGAQLLEYDDYPDLYNTIDGIAEKADIDSLDLHLIESSKPQIFTIKGKGVPGIFVSVGLLETLTDDELEASLAHEIAHIKNNDTFIRSLALGLKLASAFNLVGFLVEPALSRDREFYADQEGSQLIGGPRALISALIKLSQVPLSRTDSILLGGISFSQFNSLKSKDSLFSRHPTLDKRISRLLELK